MKQNKPHGKNLKLAGFFILGVGIIIFLSFIWKTSVLIAQSKFDGKHQFILAIGSVPVKIVCFTPETHTVNILSVNGIVMIKDISKNIGVPVDTYIMAQKQDGSAANILFD